MQTNDVYINNYKIERILGQNINQGRITYLTSDGKGLVVLKKFEFANGAAWRSYQNLEKEFKILQKINHPQIPKYIGNFETENAVILVQEYIAAENLNARELKKGEVWIIARQILKILKYLNCQKIIHKDIKPSNILWDEKRAYLVDFGFASDLAQGMPGVSSTFLGTAGFMPPETIFRGKISHAGDLYSLGITLFCLLKKIKAEEISQNIDDNYRLDVEGLELDEEFKTWLLKITDYNWNNRYQNAVIALSELDEILTKKIEIYRQRKSVNQYESCQIEFGEPLLSTISFGRDYPAPVLEENTELLETKERKSSLYHWEKKTIIFSLVMFVLIGFTIAISINLDSIKLFYSEGVIANLIQDLSLKTILIYIYGILKFMASLSLILSVGMTIDQFCFQRTNIKEWIALVLVSFFLLMLVIFIFKLAIKYL